jgi:hypothetical protein
VYHRSQYLTALNVMEQAEMRLLKTCPRIFNITILATPWSDSRSTLSSNFTAISHLTITNMVYLAALTHIHAAEYVYGDIARHNFCKRANVVFLVNSETLAVSRWKLNWPILMHFRLVLIPELHTVISQTRLKDMFPQIHG